MLDNSAIVRAGAWLRLVMGALGAALIVSVGLGLAVLTSCGGRHP